MDRLLLTYPRPSDTTGIYTGQTMNLRLEELRRRLLEPNALPNASSKTLYQRSALPNFVRREAGEVIEMGLAEDAPEAIIVAAEEPRQSVADVRVENRQIPESVSAAVMQYLQQNGLEQQPCPQESQAESGQYELAKAVAKVFDQTRSFEESLAGLRNMLDPMQQAGATLANSIEPLRSLESQIQDLAGSFDSMRTFQSQLSQLADSFAPMRCLEQQVAQFSDAFAVHLQRLSRSLDSARIFKAELTRLIQSLEPVEEMHGRFTNLIAACNPPKTMMS